MRLLSPTLGVLLLGGLLAACNGGTTGSAGGEGATTAGAETAAADIGETIATVNGVKIGSKEFEEAAARKTPESGDALSAAEKQEVIDRLVEEKLLYKAALEKGLDKDPKVQKVMVNTLLREVVYANVRNSDFTDEQLQAYYEAHKDEFVVPEKVQIKRILIRVTEDRTDDKAKAEAERILAELTKDPAKFKELAAQFSEDPYKRRGGDVGFVAADGKPGLDKAVVDKAFTLQANQLSEVFKTEEGYNIVFVAQRRERVERTFDQMKGAVLRKVKNDRLKDLYDQYVNGLKQGAKVEVMTDKVNALEIKAARKAPSLDAGLAVPSGMEGAEGEMMDEGEPAVAPAPGEEPH